jgi:hypothetical protein
VERPETPLREDDFLQGPGTFEVKEKKGLSRRLAPFFCPFFCWLSERTRNRLTPAASYSYPLSPVSQTL